MLCTLYGAIITIYTKPDALISSEIDVQISYSGCLISDVIRGEHVKSMVADRQSC